jgi:hypothetical protein
MDDRIAHPVWRPRLIMLTEQDIVQLAALALEQRGHSVTRHETWLEHSGTKFILKPRLTELHELKDGGFHSVTNYHYDPS